MRGNADLLRRAIDASGLSARGFAREVLDVDESTLYKWTRGEREMSGPAVQLCRVVVKRPDVVAMLTAPPGA